MNRDESSDREYERERDDRKDGRESPTFPTSPRSISLLDAFETIEEHWSPRIAAELNGQAVKIAVVEGEFVEHAHPDADELFYVLAGDLTIEFEDREDVHLGAGELTVVPRGVAHRPVAHEETRLVLFEPGATRNTGDRETAETHEDVERVRTG